MRYLIVLLILMMPFVQAQEFIELQTTVEVWEKEVDIPLIITLFRPELGLTDLYLEVKTVDDQIIFSKTKDEFTVISPTTMQVRIRFPKTLPEGQYYITLQARVGDDKMSITKTYSIDVINKKFMTKVYDIDKYIGYWASIFYTLIFG